MSSIIPPPSPLPYLLYLVKHFRLFEEEKRVLDGKETLSKRYVTIEYF